MPLELKKRWENYIAPYGLVSLGAGFLWKAILPSWLGGQKSVKDIAARDLSFGGLFKSIGHHFYAYEDTTAVPALVSAAYGTVLELGPAIGNQLPRITKSQITHIYGVEPNPILVDALAARVKEMDLKDMYTPILGKVEDRKLLESFNIIEGTVDSIISIQVLCSVENPEETAKMLWKLLKPGGMLVFWEHHRSHDLLSRIMQALWNPAWSLSVGCRLDRPIQQALLQAGSWEVVEMDGDEVPWSLFPRVWGKLIKK